MARPRELLSLASIADETGISYATLRNYSLKFADEIPSEGSGRNTRYPRAAVKVFQRLRRESKPGRKPASASAPVPAIKTPTLVPMPLRQEAPVQIARHAATDTGGMERELAAIKGFLERIANSLEQMASEPRRAAPVPEAAAPAAAETKPENLAPAAPEAEQRVSVPLPPIEMRGAQERGGQRRLHSLPKVMGQRGKRPE